MSCRAFSRRIEHRCLQTLFERYAARELSFAFQPTPRNGPLQEFFGDIAGQPPGTPFTLERARFEEKCPPLYDSAGESPTSSNLWIQPQPA
jgi:hypothetical protein